MSIHPNIKKFIQHPNHYYVCQSENTITIEKQGIGFKKWLFTIFGSKRYDLESISHVVKTLLATTVDIDPSLTTGLVQKLNEKIHSHNDKIGSLFKRQHIEPITLSQNIPQALPKIADLPQIKNKASLQKVNYVLPNVLMGAYPSDVNTDKATEMQNHLLNEGVTHYACLMEDDEIDGKKGKNKFTRYEGIAHDLASKKGRTVTYLSPVQIPDVQTVADTDVEAAVQQLLPIVKSSENKLYIHCHGGNGRTSIVTTVLLSKLYKIPFEEALLHVFKSSLQREAPLRPYLPESAEQFEQIKRLCFKPHDVSSTYTFDQWRAMCKEICRRERPDLKITEEKVVGGNFIQGALTKISTTVTAPVVAISAPDLRTLLKNERPHNPPEIQALEKTGCEYWKKKQKAPVPNQKKGSRNPGWLKNTFGKAEAAIRAELKTAMQNNQLAPPKPYSVQEIETALHASKPATVTAPIQNQIRSREGVSVNDWHFVPADGVENEDLAIIQLASQFDYQEAVEPVDTPVESYLGDPTQGPQGAIEAAAAALYRKAAKDAGLLPHALARCISKPLLDKCYKHGYLELSKLDVNEKKQLLQELTNNIDKLEILPQHVVCERSGNPQIQVCTAAPSFQGQATPSATSVENQICALLVIAQYKAIAQLAVIRSREIGKTIPLHLTLVSQGVFNNNPQVIGMAIKAVAEVVKGENVQVIYECFSSSDREKLIQGAQAANTTEYLPH